jgi:hypothetical protein
MGYDLHITRALECWYDNPTDPILESEWVAIVDADPELRMATPDDDYYMPGMVLWSRKFAGFGGPWLCWSRGSIYSKNPNGAIIAKMLELASLLRARVQGDDCEVYLPDGGVLQASGGRSPDVDWRAW